MISEDNAVQDTATVQNMNRTQLAAPAEEHVVNAMLQIRNPQGVLQRTSDGTPILPVLMAYNAEDHRLRNVLRGAFEKINAPCLDCVYVVSTKMFSDAVREFECFSFCAGDGIVPAHSANP